MTRLPIDLHSTSPHSIALGAGLPPDLPARRRVRAPGTAAWLLVLVGSIAGCAGPTTEPSLGTVTANLVGQAPSGTIYRLRHAVITVTGFGNTRVWNTEDNPDRTSLSDDVVVGNYTASLAPGWSLERIEGALATPVTAQLVSDNPVDFLVSPQQRTLVPLRFHVDTDVVDMSQGYDLVLTVEESTPQLIVVANLHGFQSGSITVYPGQASGDVSPLRTIEGSLTTLSSPTAVAVTDDEIVVCDGGIGAVSFFPIQADGDVAPTRQIIGPDTEVGGCRDVAVYQGEVYVLESDQILVFPLSANGDAAPVRRTAGFFFAGESFAIDGSDLYLAKTNGEILVYPLPLADDAAPARIFSVDCPFGIAVAEGELFLSNDCGLFGRIDVYPATGTGPQSALRSLVGDHTGLQTPEQIKRFRDELYVSDSDAEQVLIYPAGASEDAAPARAIGGPHTGMSTPVGLAVH
jgi:hypothetical protein